jgi:hypothetical protein
MVLLCLFYILILCMYAAYHGLVYTFGRLSPCPVQRVWHTDGWSLNLSSHLSLFGCYLIFV